MNGQDSSYFLDHYQTGDEWLTSDSLYPDTMVFCVMQSYGLEKLRINKKCFQYHKEINAEDLKVDVEDPLVEEVTKIFFFELIRNENMESFVGSHIYRIFHN